MLRLRRPSPLRRPPHGEPGLPLQLTRFFGREAELAQLEALLRQERRLVTLTGPGGSGKTRLALELLSRRRSAGSTAGNGWFVPLADLGDPRRIPGRLQEALGLPRLPDEQPLDQIIRFLSFQPASLLLLDNFEHLVREGAALLRGLLQRAPAVTLLVTSRRRLGLAGEREFPVGPLPVPRVSDEGGGMWEEVKTGFSSSSSLPPLSSLLSSPSVALFLDRAQAARPDFQLTPRNAAAVASLCARLEGIPLALELAAARSQTLSPAQMLARLTRTPAGGAPGRFELLARRRPDAAPRHCSLWAALDGSYQLLSPELKRFFTALSVFRGGWTAEAAGAVGEKPDRALELLTLLHSFSLIGVEDGEPIPGTELRYQMLETLREFATEQLSPEERWDLARRHAEYYASLAEHAAPKLEGSEQLEWLQRLDAEHENLRAALAWTTRAVEPAGAAPQPLACELLQIGLRLGTALRLFWNLRHHNREGLRWLEPLIAQGRGASGDRVAALRARALVVASATTGAVGDSIPTGERLERARCYSEEGLALGRQLGDRATMAHCLSQLGAIHREQGRTDHGARLHEQSLALFWELGDHSGMAGEMGNLGYLSLEQGDEERARLLAEKSLRSARLVGSRWRMGLPLHILWRIAHRQGDLPLAQRLCEERLSIVRELGMPHLLPQVLNNLGQVALDAGDVARAERCFAESLIAARQADFSHFELAWALSSQGDVARRQGDAARARRFYEESVPLYREVGYLLGAAHALNGLGVLAREAGELERSRALLQESLRLRAALHHDALPLASLEELAALFATAGESERAARLLAAAEALWPAVDEIPRFTPGHPRLERTPTEALARQLRARCPAAWAEGCALSLDAAIRSALG